MPDAVTAASVEDVVARAARDGIDVVVVDLARPGVAEQVPALVAAAGRVVAFAPHVETELLERAAAAGAEAMPRSRFFRDVAEAVHG